MNIRQQILQELEKRANTENISIDALVERLLQAELVEQHLEALIENFDGQAWSIDKHYCLLVSNQRFYEALHYVEGRDVHPGENLLKLKFPPQTIEKWQALYNRALAGEKFSLEMPTQHAPSAKDMEYHFNPIRDKQGQVAGVSIFARDISEQKKAETALRQSEGRFKLAAQIARLGIWDWDIASDKTDWYGEMFHIYGISEAEFTGMGTDYIYFTREDYRLKQAENIQNAFAKGMTETEIHAGKAIPIDPKELCIVRPDGSECFTMGDAIAIIDENGKPLRMLGVTLDITEMKRAEQNLRVKDNALESSITAIALADMQGRLNYVNPAFVELWKLQRREDALGRSVLEFWANPDDAVMVIEQIQMEQHVRGQMRAKLADATVADLAFTASIVRDAAGEAICMMGSFTDVTQQLQAEQLRLEQERLKASLKKEQEFNVLVQKAVSTLSHDIHTPLTVISNAKQMLDRYFDRLDEEQRREKLNSIGKQLHYVLELLNEMSLTVKGRLDERIFQASPLHLETFCHACIDEIQETIGNQHRFSFISDGQTGLALVDETLLSRVLLNLLSNAVKFSPRHSEISLSLTLDNGQIVLQVRDTGMGISSEDLPHIFEPFYRAETVSQIRGTGLGLHIVKDCVERHGGSITVESELGKGSRFIIRIPYLAG